MKKRNRHLAATGRRIMCAAVMLAAAQMIHAQSILGNNLIVNGNAEAGPAGTVATLVSSIPGWTQTGTVNVLPYNLTNYILLSDPGPPDRTFQYFTAAGNKLTTSTLTQT